MAKQIHDLSEIAKMRFGTVVFFKDSVQQCCDDYYRFGVVLPRLPSAIEEGARIQVQRAYNETFYSPIIDEIRAGAGNDPYRADWDCEHKVTLNRYSTGIPKSRMLIGGMLPVPERQELAEKFAEGLEANLNQ
jgi:hypothetical protein